MSTTDASFTVETLIERSRLNCERVQAEAEASIRATWAAVDALKAEGFDVEHSTYDASSIRVDVDVADLPRVYRAVGRVEVWYKDVAHDRNTGKPSVDTVLVVLRAVKAPSVTFRYRKPLPPADATPSGRKCRIVTTSRVETSTSLVCDR